MLATVFMNSPVIASACEGLISKADNSSEKTQRVLSLDADSPVHGL